MGGGFYYHSPDPNPLNKAEAADDGWTHGFEVTRRRGEGDGDDDGCEIGNIVGLELGHYFGRSATRKIEGFAMENWRRMGYDVSVNCSSLKRIDLSGGDVSAEAIAVIFGDAASCACPLESLDLSRVELGPVGMEAMLPFIRSTSKTLKCLYLGNAELGPTGARLLSEVLKNNYDRLHELDIGSNGTFDGGVAHISDALECVRIDFLHLGCNGIGDAGIERLLSARNARHLDELYIENNRIERHNGFDAIAQFLQRDDAEIRILRLGSMYQEFYQFGFRMLVSSLSDNTTSKLEVLGVLGISPTDMGDESYPGLIPCLQRLVCDTSSFESLCRSNHRLRVRLANDYMSDFDPILKKAFHINARSTSINQRVRSKLRNFYFQGDFYVEPFMCMDVVFMPRVLHLLTRGWIWVDKKERILRGEYSRDLLEVPSNNINGVYRLVRNCHLPELFSYLSPQPSKFRD